MQQEFEWDEVKAILNVEKHGVSFDYAKTVFADDLALVRPDIKHSEYEERFTLIGHTDTGYLLLVSYTMRGENIRIISSRRANEKERKAYTDPR